MDFRKFEQSVIYSRVRSQKNSRTDLDINMTMSNSRHHFGCAKFFVAFREFETMCQDLAVLASLMNHFQDFQPFLLSLGVILTCSIILSLDCFINQDGDSFLFQLYRRWNCSVLLPHVRLVNLIGGPNNNDARYTKQHTDKRTVKPLNDSVETVAICLQKHGYTECKRVITLDVNVPTF